MGRDWSVVVQPEVVLDVNGRVWTFKGKKLLGAGGWTIPDLLKQVREGREEGDVGRTARIGQRRR